MGAPRQWTISEHAEIVAARSRMEPWDSIGKRFGVHRTTLVNYARKVGIWTPDVTHKAVVEYDDEEPVRDPWPLPAGHPVSWGAICAGTVLDGTDYPR